MSRLANLHHVMCDFGGRLGAPEDLVDNSELIRDSLNLTGSSSIRTGSRYPTDGKIALIFEHSGDLMALSNYHVLGRRTTTTYANRRSVGRCYSTNAHNADAAISKIDHSLHEHCSPGVNGVVPTGYRNLADSDTKVCLYRGSGDWVECSIFSRNCMVDVTISWRTYRLREQFFFEFPSAGTFREGDSGILVLDESKEHILGLFIGGMTLSDVHGSYEVGVVCRAENVFRNLPDIDRNKINFNWRHN